MRRRPSRWSTPARKLFGSPAELVEGCDTLIVMLLNDAATEAVYHGPNGILKAKLAGKLVIDMSTIRPDTMTSIGAAVLQQGAAFVECPVAAAPGRRRRASCSGWSEARKPDVARAMPILEQLCRRIEHVGTLGAGATMKLAVNLPLLVYWQALGEALTICKPLKLARRPADRHPVRHRRHADRHERPRRRDRQGAGRRAARSKPPSASARQKRISPRRCNSPRPSTPSFLSRQAPLPASRKPKRPASAMPTPPRFRCAGRSSRPPNPDVTMILSHPERPTTAGLIQ